MPLSIRPIPYQPQPGPASSSTGRCRRSTASGKGLAKTSLDRPPTPFCSSGLLAGSRRLAAEVGRPVGLRGSLRRDAVAAASGSVPARPSGRTPHVTAKLSFHSGRESAAGQLAQRAHSRGLPTPEPHAPGPRRFRRSARGSSCARFGLSCLRHRSAFPDRLAPQCPRRLRQCRAPSERDACCRADGAARPV
jgi:hypothetical protein